MLSRNTGRVWTESKLVWLKNPWSTSPTPEWASVPCPHPPPPAHKEDSTAMLSLRCSLAPPQCQRMSTQDHHWGGGGGMDGSFKFKPWFSDGDFDKGLSWFLVHPPHPWQDRECYVKGSRKCVCVNCPSIWFEFELPPLPAFIWTHSRPGLMEAEFVSALVHITCQLGFLFPPGAIGQKNPLRAQEMACVVRDHKKRPHAGGPV